MANKKSDQRLFDQLERLFIKESFQKTISRCRKEIGIPIKGFGSNGEYISWIRKNDRKFFDIQNTRAKICLQFGLPLNFSPWIEGYLLLGGEFKQFNRKNPIDMSFFRGFEKPGYGCALEKDPDFHCVNIKVFPGASYREIMKYVRENMAEIEDFLAPFDERVRPIRKRRQSERDSQIYECYRDGLLNRYGEITVAIDDRSVLIPASIRKINDTDIIRKIIGEQIKMRK